MKKAVTLILSIVLVLTLLASCGSAGTTSSAASSAASSKASSSAASSSTASSSAASSSSAAASSAAGTFDKKYEWHLATTYSSTDSATLAYKKFAELLSQKTNGMVTVDIDSDGALGGENDTIMSVSAGDLEFVGSGTGPVFLYTPEYSFLMGVFLVDTYEQWTKLWESSTLDGCRTKLASDHNIVNVSGFGYRGYRNYTSNKKFTNASEFAAAGIKMRMNTNPNWMASWNALGCTCVTIALGELYSSLQNGTVDAAEGPWTQDTSYALQEQQKYVMETKHTFEGSAIWMGKAFYDALPADYQKAITAASQEAMDYLDQIGPEAEKQQLQKMLDAGCEKVEIDRDSFLTAAKPFLQKCFTDTWTGATYEDVMKAIA